ncbi:inosine monophosphate dehydrogenase [Trematosphaeria pertusa]|uniref:Inosine monophosphate dehydrogenase n=1 Tax=Trematosphaeria pertusa TaxID=390896 RepID=A0A6A6INJ9_9PLEO|nr:inosine monophosphate dehydrogenase [Trematosphaeria pertusa]KAF2251402.1 inosine monophosphate dehydrogenase [Trematosphaeria pertusa]
MAGSAGGALASAVSLSGGVGMIGCLFSLDDVRKELNIAAKNFKASSNPSISSSRTLPLGVGFLTFVLNLKDVLPVVEEFKPAIVWLFAAKELDDYKVWAAEIRKASPESNIWIQVGNVSAAVHIARTASPDVLCLQGADAGGHGFEKGCGIISLLPESADALVKEGLGQIPLVAAGGIVDGRGVAAALALGAQGVVMGTRFLASEQITIHPAYQSAVLEASDGGQVTKRSKLFDELRGPNMWPAAYDGRSLVVQSYKDHLGGMSIEEIQKLHNEAVKEDDNGFKPGLKGRAAIWAGTGVGMVKEVESARDIVEGVRRDAMEILGRVLKI